MLLVFGIYCFKSDPMKNMHKPSNKQGTLMHNGITAFLVTLSNPLIVFLFMATFAQFAFVVPDMPVEMGVGYLSIVFGALLWWFGLTWLIDTIRNKFDTNGIVIINKVIGSVVIIFSIIALFGTISICIICQNFKSPSPSIRRRQSIKFKVNSSKFMFVAQELRKKSIAEYLLYMWQIEDIIRAYGCSLPVIKKIM